MLRQSTRRSDQRSREKQTLVLVIVVLAAIAVAGVRAAQPNDPTESGAPQKYAPPADPSQQNEPSERTRITPMAPPGPLNATRYLPGGAPAGPASAVALIQVARQPRRVTGEGRDGESDQAWQILCKTQLALLKSYFVLQSALRDSKISNLPLIQAQEEPVEWLANRIDVGFKQGSEIMYVQMSGEKRDAEQLRKLVDAVVKKYEEEVVWASEQRRLSNRDLLAQSVKKLGDEISQKMQDYLEMARASESNESGRGQVAQQLDLRRLERIEEELMRLENDQLQLETSGGNGSPIFFEKRIQQLSERRADLEKRIMSRSEASVDLTQRKQEIDRLQQIMDDLSRNLELMDVEASAPPRIQLIQPAIVVGAGKYADGDEARSKDKPEQ
jgi:hypothetical protein